VALFISDDGNLLPFCCGHQRWGYTREWFIQATRGGSTPNGAEFDYSSLAGFRVARTLH
jgi:hypothetical protein